MNVYVCGEPNNVVRTKKDLFFFLISKKANSMNR